MTIASAKTKTRLNFHWPENVLAIYGNIEQMTGKKETKVVTR